MRNVLRLALLAALAGSLHAATLEEVLANYTEALGGKAAIEAIKTREIHANGMEKNMLLLHRRFLFYWQAPNKCYESFKVELSAGQYGFDGKEAWFLPARGKIRRIPPAKMDSMQRYANPLVYVHLKDMYPGLHAAAPQKLDGEAMDVLEAPLRDGVVQFLFDAKSHLLRQIGEKHDSEVQNKEFTFDDYRDVEDTKFPFRMGAHFSMPDQDSEELRITKVRNNAKLKPRIFQRPLG